MLFILASSVFSLGVKFFPVRNFALTFRIAAVLPGSLSPFFGFLALRLCRFFQSEPLFTPPSGVSAVEGLRAVLLLTDSGATVLYLSGTFILQAQGYLNVEKSPTTHCHRPAQAGRGSKIIFYTNLFVPHQYKSLQSALSTKMSSLVHL